MTTQETGQRSISNLRRMVLQGAEYREEYELDYFGETEDLFLMPLKDEVFTELLEDLEDVMGEGEFEEKMGEMDDMDDDEIPDEDEFSVDFVRLMRKAAALGIDHEAADETQEGVEELLDMMVGGVSIEIGAEVMEITSNLQEAERFRKK